MGSLFKPKQPAPPPPTPPSFSGEVERANLVQHFDSRDAVMQQSLDEIRQLAAKDYAPNAATKATLKEWEARHEALMSAALVERRKRNRPKGKQQKE